MNADPNGPSATSQGQTDAAPETPTAATTGEAGGPAEAWDQTPPVDTVTPSGNTSAPGVSLSKGVVTEKDIFSLAKQILLISGSVYLFFAIMDVLAFPKIINSAKMDAVWDYSKVFLNSIISLVLGLYFGAKKDNSNK
jgi:hypothetical protein